MNQQQRLRAAKWYLKEAFWHIALLCGIGIPRLAILTNVGQIDSIDEFKALFGDLHNDRYIQLAYKTYMAVLQCDELGQQILFELYFVDNERRDYEMWKLLGISARKYYMVKKQALLCFSDCFEQSTAFDLCQQRELLEHKS